MSICAEGEAIQGCRFKLAALRTSNLDTLVTVRVS